MTLHTSTATIIGVYLPTAFADSIGALAADAGAFAEISPDDHNVGTVSYVNLDRLPRIIGPIISTDVAENARPLGGYYETGLEGSSFVDQRRLLKSLATRPLSAAAVRDIDYMLDEHRSLETRAGLKPVVNATLHFLKGVSFMRSRHFEDAASWFEDAAHRFGKIDLKCADAISRVFRVKTLEAAMKGDEESDLSDEEIGFERSYAAHGLLDALEESGGESTTSAIHSITHSFIYLYGLHLAKNTPFRPLEGGSTMQGLFMRGAQLLEGRWLIDEAMRAYIASAWSITQKVNAKIGSSFYVVSDEDRHAAVKALSQAERLNSKSSLGISSERILDLIRRLGEAKATRYAVTKYGRLDDLWWAFTGINYFDLDGKRDLI